MAIIAGLVAVYWAIPIDASRPTDPAIRYVPVLPLALSGVVRWLVIPRIKERVRAFPMFVVGIALAEACGMLGIFLAPDLRLTYLVLSLAGLAQFVPVFASCYEK